MALSGLGWRTGEKRITATIDTMDVNVGNTVKTRGKCKDLRKKESAINEIHQSPFPVVCFCLAEGGVVV